MTEEKVIDWIANEVSREMADAFFRGNLNMEIFPKDKRPDYDCARRIAKKFGLTAPAQRKKE